MKIKSQVNHQKLKLNVSPKTSINFFLDLINKIGTYNLNT